MPRWWACMLLGVLIRAAAGLRTPSVRGARHGVMRLLLLLAVPGASSAESITVSGGSYPGEVSWALSCSDGASASGGNPYTGNITVAGGATCTLAMSDSYGDGWNGALWSGFGQSLTLSSGASGTGVFVVPHSPPTSP
eukprot:3505969-Prymnesium_polylepis.1